METTNLSGMFRPQRQRHNSGFNLIEAAIVLGVVGLIIGGIWVAAASVQENNKQRVFIGNLISITGKIQSKFGGVSLGGLASVSFADISFGSVYIRKSGWDGVIPPDMIGGSDKTYPIDPWGNDVTIGIVNSTAKYISIRWFNADVARCISVGSKMVGQTRSMASTAFLAAAAITNPTAVFSATAAPLYSTTDIKSACTTNPTLQFFLNF